MVDVSVVLNVHREFKYFRRTMLSLEEAVDHAAGVGITLELVVVLDNSDAATRAWFEAYDAGRFVRYEQVPVSNGALGSSRNDGIARARARYIATYDADDLVSFNYLTELCQTARRRDGPVIVFPQYVFCFGAQSYLHRLYGYPELSRLAFLAAHPLISRQLASREVYERIGYAHIGYDPARPNLRYAFEDWHLNGQAVAHGIELAIAPSTVLFYRQRAAGLALHSSIFSTGQIPPSDLFEPARYRRVCAPDYERARGRWRGPTPDEIRADFLADAVCQEAAEAAHRIDPGIDFTATPRMEAFANIAQPTDVGEAYFEVCETLIDRCFTDVAFLPAVAQGGGLGFLCDLLAAREARHPERALLILTGEGGNRHEALHRFSARTVLIDLFHRFPGLQREHRQLLALKLLQSVAEDSSLHLAPCSFAHDFFARFGALLDEHRTFYYADAAPAEMGDRGATLQSAAFAFADDQAERLERVITIDASALLAMQRLLGEQGAKRVHVASIEEAEGVLKP